MMLTTGTRLAAFHPAERALLGQVLGLLRRSPLKPGAERRSYLRELRAQLRRLDLLARAIGQTPSLYGEQRMGPRRRDIRSLIESLSQSSLFDLELHMPLRALIGRTMLMAKVSFFRLIRHMLGDAVGPDASSPAVRANLERTLCTCIYVKIAEEILVAIVCDGDLPADTRRKAAALLCQIWENGPTYQVADFFPVLESVWEARRQARVVFGTLLGTSELFELMRAGCDDRFIRLFSQEQVTPDQRLAFQEFLFLTGGPELDLLMDHVREGTRVLGPDQAARLLDSPPQRFDLSSQAAEKMYESFRRRHLAAMARRSRPDAGASRTAEEYIMLHLLDQTDLDVLLGEPAK